MTREELRALGLADDVVDKIMSINGADVNAHRQAAETERARADGLAGQLEQLNAALSTANNEALTAKQLREQLAAAQSQLETSKKAAAIRGALGEYKPRDADLMLRLLDDSKITVGDDGKINGLAEQMSALRTSNAFLFADAPTERGGAPTSGSAPATMDMNTILRGGTN